MYYLLNSKICSRYRSHTNVYGEFFKLFKMFLMFLCTQKPFKFKNKYIFIVIVKNYDVSSCILYIITRTEKLFYLRIFF